MIYMNKTKVTTGIIATLAVLGFFLMYIFDSEYKKKQERLFEEGVESSMVQYYEYLEENGGNTFVSNDRIIVTNDFLKEYSHENEDVEAEVTRMLAEETNDSLESVFQRDLIYLNTVKELEEIMQYSYITEENLELYEKAKQKANDLANYLNNSTDEDYARSKQINATRIEVGYSENQVLNKLGNPNNITKSTSSVGEIKVFTYDSQFIYIHDGIVDRVVEF